LAIVASGDCRSLPITGNNSDERRNCLHGRCAHIFANEKRAIFNGDSFTASFLMGFRATAEQSATNFSKAWRNKTTHVSQFSTVINGDIYIFIYIKKKKLANFFVLLHEITNPNTSEVSEVLRNVYTKNFKWLLSLQKSMQIVTKQWNKWA